MNCQNPKLLWPHRSIEYTDRRKEKPVCVPCGKCVACLVNKRQDWCFRLYWEHRASTSSYFVTLTYDEKHLRTNRSLCKRDLQLYMKRLRKADVGTRIRYFGVGEYGGKTGRPHYHLLLFNVTDEKFIRGAWCDSKGKPIGIVHIGKVTEASIAYTTKYIVQPVGEVLDEEIEKPFSLMSRAYGIGANYLTDQMVYWHRCDNRNFAMMHDQKTRLPRFYRDKIWPSVKSDGSRLQDHIALRYSLGREAVSDAAMKLVEAKRRDAERVLREKFGDRWNEVNSLLVAEELKRVKTKVTFSQKF